jgi:hypothetical protein
MLTDLAREETLTSAGGARIFVRSWRPEGRAKAVVAIVHGFNSHGGPDRSHPQNEVALRTAGSGSRKTSHRVMCPLQRSPTFEHRHAQEVPSHE